MFEDKMKKCLLFIYFLLISNGVLAQGSSSLNLAIPQSSGSYQSDRVRSSDNVECSMAIGSATNVEFGVVGILNQNNPYDSVYTDPALRPDNGFVRDVGVYARITIPIGAPKERLNCNKLYKLELEKKELEVIKLRQEIQNLRELRFEGGQ